MKLPVAIRGRLGRARRFGLHIVQHRLMGRPLPGPFIVLTTSRSGSTWFCSLISNALCIEPTREDFRPHHFQSFCEGQSSAADLLELARQSFRVTDVPPKLGSKLIWDNVPELQRRLSEEEIAAFADLYTQIEPRLLRLVRRDRVAQAVSRYIAARSGVFHKILPPRRGHPPGDLPAAKPTPEDGIRAPLDAADISYDFKAIKKHYDPLVRAELHLDQTIEQTGLPVHTVIYEELLEDPIKHLGAALNLLLGDAGLKPYLAQRVQKTVALERFVPTTSELNQGLAMRFTHDLTLPPDAR